MYNLDAKETFFKLKEIRGDKVFYLKHFFRMPLVEEWAKYLRSRGYVGLSKGRNTFEFSNVLQEEDEEFWGLLILRVEGYTFQGKDIMTLTDWKEKIPIKHKLEVIGGFLSFNRSEDTDKETVGEGLDLSDMSGTTLKFSAIFNDNEELLVFNFSVPATSDYIKYTRVASRTQMVRTKQKNVSEIHIPMKLDVFISLFDKLIISTEGYKFAEKEDWKNQVPLLHKREAIRELFSGSLRVDEEAESD